MSELDSLGEQTDEEPPPIERGLSVGAHLDDFIDRIGEGSLYTSYKNPGRKLYTSVNALDLEIVGEVGYCEIAKLLLPPIHESVGLLEQRISKAMARVAVEYGADLSPDSEYDYPVFISPAKDGEIGIMFRDPQIDAMMISRRSRSNQEMLSLESRNIRTVFELLVLLGGFSVFLAAIETNQHQFTENNAVQ